jgi:hypothetical protein
MGHKIMNILPGFKKTALTGILLTSGILASGVAVAETAGASKSADQNQVIFAYQPPMRGAPAARIGGGTRGVGGSTLELVALAPDHTGLTTKEQPTLYWYLSEPAPAKLEVTLINDEDIDPELEQALTSPVQSGVQHIDLSGTEARLKPGLEYRWFVSVVADPAQRSNDVIASGTIKRIAPDDALMGEISKAGESDLARVYAENGIWYDAIDALSRNIMSKPDDTKSQQQLMAILEQVGLESAAKNLTIR